MPTPHVHDMLIYISHDIQRVRLLSFVVFIYIWADSVWLIFVYRAAVKKCHSILFPVTGNMTCVDILEPFSFGSRCNFTCQEGYRLRGEATLSCLASGKWSGPPPACTGGSLKTQHFLEKHKTVALLWQKDGFHLPVVQCNSLRTPSSATMQCQDPLGEYSYGSICISQCEEGFDLIGTNVTKCSSHGNWTDALPLCQGMRIDE